MMNYKLFGPLEVNIKVPDHLKQKFVKMPPVFRNVEISRDDIGDHMKKYEEHHESTQEKFDW